MCSHSSIRQTRRPTRQLIRAAVPNERAPNERAASHPTKGYSLAAIAQTESNEGVQTLAVSCVQQARASRIGRCGLSPVHPRRIRSIPGGGQPVRHNGSGQGPRIAPRQLRHRGHQGAHHLSRSRPILSLVLMPHPSTLGASLVPSSQPSSHLAPALTPIAAVPSLECSPHVQPPMRHVTYP